jgi:hypothetical protein
MAVWIAVGGNMTRPLEFGEDIDTVSRTPTKIQISSLRGFPEARGGIMAAVFASVSNAHDIDPGEG